MPHNNAYKNFRGRSFKGKTLTGADFSYADIRGADFEGALLRGADFSHAKAGLRPSWIFTLVTAIILEHLIGVGFIPSVAIYQGMWIENLPNGFLVETLFVFVAFVTFYKGLGFAAGTLAAAISLTLLVMGVVALAGVKLPFLPLTVALPVVIAWLAVVFIGTHVALVTALTTASIGTMVVVGYEIGSLAGAWIQGLALKRYETVVSAVVYNSAWAMIEIALSSYIGWRILVGDKRFALVRGIVLACASLRGTSFRGADLTDADFTQATLKSTDFREANLTRTNLYRAKNLDLARVDNTILTNSDVQALVVNRRGANKSYVGYNLTGANLTGANLTGANLTGADVSEATFREACLEQANLTKTQALKTDFQQAWLTGACIEAWNIDSTTQLGGVLCDYVYLLNDQQERRPSSGRFGPSEFTKLFQEVLNTIDLIFRNGIDWKALNYSFCQLQVKNKGTPLLIQSIENKGDGVVVVRVNVPADANKEKLHAEFTQNYEIALKALEEKYRSEIKSKDEQIAIYRQHQSDLKSLIEFIASKPVQYREVSTATPTILPSSKLVILKLGQGDLNTGFPVTLQIGSEGVLPSVQFSGRLTSASELFTYYNQWQSAYRSLGASFRLEIPDTQVTNVTRREFFEECHEFAEDLKKHVNLWLNSNAFRPIKEKLLEQLSPSDLIRVILQTEDGQLQRLPFQLWDFFDRYPGAEFALSTPIYERIEKFTSPTAKVRILAILGDSTGINLDKDRALLNQLPETEVTFLPQPQRQKLNDQIWMQPWDILFFAGHSSCQTVSRIGQIHINSTDSLTIPELKYALRKAIKQGLKLAIFNSCDGLGLAVNMSDLHIPQMIVMREPVPDQVAHEFLKNFLAAFSSGKPLYQSVREARERLQGLEDQFPCASWLPVIYQNPAEVPLTWQELRGV